MKPALAALGLVTLTLAGCIAQPGAPAQNVLGDPLATVAPLVFRDRVAFPNPTFPVQLGTTCTEKDDGDLGCGLDEPSIVVDAQERVFYTAACCFVVSSPVFVSEDAGATFRALEHPLKDAYGNEGDVSVDAQGNLYYMDIDLATFGVARWDASLQAQNYVRRPGEPLVDRPWVRGLADGVVLAVYNTGSDTIAYRSDDAGMTFTAQPVARFGSALAGGYGDSRHDLVGMVGGGGYMESADGGVTWGPRTDVEGCDTDPTPYNNEGAAVDEAGTVWHWRNGCIVGRRADGSWTASSAVFPEGADVPYSWVAAGAPGAAAVAFYAQFADAAQAAQWGVATDAWHVYVAYAADAAEGPWTTALADPDPVGMGDALGRRLGDFLQVALGPDGAIHVAYAMNPEMDDSAIAVYRRTEAIPALAPSVPLVGPFEAAPNVGDPSEEAKATRPIA